MLLAKRITQAAYFNFSHFVYVFSIPCVPFYQNSFAEHLFRSKPRFGWPGRSYPQHTAISSAYSFPYHFPWTIDLRICGDHDAGTAVRQPSYVNIARLVSSLKITKTPTVLIHWSTCCWHCNSITKFLIHLQYSKILDVFSDPFYHRPTLWKAIKRNY